MTVETLLVWCFCSFMAGGLFGAMTMAVLVASKATPLAPPRPAHTYKSTTKTVRKRNTSTSSTPRPKT
jgi:hypothetical protein